MTHAQCLEAIRNLVPGMFFATYTEYSEFKHSPPELRCAIYCEVGTFRTKPCPNWQSAYDSLVEHIHGITAADLKAAMPEVE